MKDYYQILRVSRHASDAEIKRAYRRLAVVFHPDKNPTEEASALFQEINEANEVLSDPEKRAKYDFLLIGGFSPKSPAFEPRWHPDPAYRRKYRPGYRRPPPRPPEHLLMMAHFLKYLRTLCLVGLGFCGFLFLDYLLPHRIDEERVVSELNRIYNWRFDHVPDVVVTDHQHQFPVLHDGVDFFPEGSMIRIHTSRVLHLLVKVESGDKRYTIYQLDSVYQNFLWVPIMLLIFSIFGLTLRSGIEFRFSFGVAIIMVLLFNIIFIIFSTV